MPPLFSEWRSLLGNLFFPAFCRNCRIWLGSSREKYFCSNCWNKLLLIENFCSCCGLPVVTRAASPLCGGCREKPPSFRRARAAGHYEGVLRQAVHIFKYEGKISLGETLAQLMVKEFPRYWSAWDYDFLLPVPLHPKRLRKREFNQSFVLARYLGKYFDTPVLSDKLQRVKFNRPQVGLTRKERLNNAKGCFELRRPEQLQGKKLLLVDDVYTTGATIKECARLLSNAGTDFVDVYTVCRA